MQVSPNHCMIHVVISSTRPYDSPLRQGQAEATRTRIVKALCDLLVDERPSSVSIPAVARRAGVSVRSVYHHFPTKDDLFSAIEPYVQHEIRGHEVSDEEILSAANDVVSMMRQELPGLARNASLFSALVKAGIDDDERARARRAARLELFADALQRQLPDLDRDECHRLAVLLSGVASWASVQRMEQAGLDVDEIVDLLAWTTEIVMDEAQRSGKVGPPTVAPGKPNTKRGNS